jgi:type I restriction enzyme M protein
LFIDARKMGRMVSRVRRELTDEEIAKIAATYHAWRGNAVAVGVHRDAPHRDAPYRDIPGFCKSASLEEVRKHGYVLTPGRYVGAAEQEDDDEPFEQKMGRLVAQLRAQQAEAARLDAAIVANLKALVGFWEEGA